MTRQAAGALSFCIAVVLCTPFGAMADANRPSANKTQASAVNEAKRLFDEAMVQLSAGRADIGRDLLRQSLALYSTLPTRFNLAVALQRTGQTTESVAMFEGLLREPSLRKKDRAMIEEGLRGARAELATIAIRVTGVEVATVEIDGREIGEARAGEVAEFPVDAGEHVVVARAGGSTRQRVKVDRGKTVQVDLHVMSIAQQNAAKRKAQRRKRAAWGTGASAVIAGVVLAAVLATRPTGEKDPADGTIPAVSTLRRR